MAEKNAEVRIVKKVGGGHAGHHGGAWKVAYADFMTAMMAFFLVMWIVGLNNADIKNAVASYFKNPTGFMKAVNGGSAPFAVNENMAGGLQPETTTPRNSISDERGRLEQVKRAIEKVVAVTPEFKNLSKYIDIKIANEGLRIDLLEVKESLFFDSGSAKVKPATKRLLSRIAQELQQLPNKVIIEGHTDSRPLNRNDGYTNWELSADRANSARQVMAASGLSDKKISQVRGYAATQPRDPQHPEHYSNRRVSIVVMYTQVSCSNQMNFGSDVKTSYTETRNTGSTADAKK